MAVVAAKAESRLPKGASLGLALGVSKAGWRRDPLVLTSSDCIKQYGSILWDGHLSRQVCEALMSQAQAHARKPRPWVSCKDPVQALVLTMM